MAKKQRPSLADFAQHASPNIAALEAAGPPKREPTFVRKDRPHTTLYLDRRVVKVIKEIALHYDKKPHDLLIEGVNLMLARYGRPSVGDLSK